MWKNNANKAGHIYEKNWRANITTLQCFEMEQCSKYGTTNPLKEPKLNTEVKMCNGWETCLGENSGKPQIHSLNYSFFNRRFSSYVRKIGKLFNELPFRNPFCLSASTTNRTAKECVQILIPGSSSQDRAGNILPTIEAATQNAEKLRRILIQVEIIHRSTQPVDEASSAGLNFNDWCILSDFVLWL